MPKYIKIINEPKEVQGIAMRWDRYIGLCVRLGNYNLALEGARQALHWNIEQRFKNL